MNYIEIMNQAETYVFEQRRYKSAKELYQQALDRFPEHTLNTAFNYGVLNQMFIGNGEEARQLYETAVKERYRTDQITPHKDQREFLDQIEANACENMMLISLSYEEYDDWSNRLEKLQPEAAILTGQKPKIHELRDHGYPWSHVMQVIAQSSYHSDPHTKKASGRPANAASIYKLLLKNRRTLRLPRKEYRLVIIGYASLISMIWAECGYEMEKARGQLYPDEFNSIVTDALPEVEEYVKANPTDSKGQEVLKLIKDGLKQTAQHVVTKPNHVRSTYTRPASARSTYAHPAYQREKISIRCSRCLTTFSAGTRESLVSCPNCGLMTSISRARFKQWNQTTILGRIAGFNGLVIGGAAGYYLHGSLPRWSTIILGALVGLILIPRIVYQIAKLIGIRP